MHKSPKPFSLPWSCPWQPYLIFMCILLQHFGTQPSWLNEYLDTVLPPRCLLPQVPPLSSLLASLVPYNSQLSSSFSLPSTYRFPPKPLPSSSVFSHHLFFTQASLQQSLTLFPTPPHSRNTTFPSPTASQAHGHQTNLMLLSPVTTTLSCLVQTCSCPSVM